MTSMLAAAYGSVSDIEILWVLIATAGLGFSIFNIREAWSDKKALKVSGVGNGRKKIADYALRAEVSRATIQFIFASIGILAMFLAESPDSLQQPWHVAALGFAIRWGLITAAILIAMKSYWSWRLRQILRDQYSINQATEIVKTDVTGEVEIRTDEVTGENTITGSFGNDTG